MRTLLNKTTVVFCNWSQASFVYKSLNFNICCELGDTHRRLMNLILVTPLAIILACIAFWAIDIMEMANIYRLWNNV